MVHWVLDSKTGDQISNVKSVPDMLIPGRRGLSGSISSSDVAIVLMASWYSGVELGMAYFDIWDIIRDRGFWEGGASGEDVKGMLGLIELVGWLMGVELELLGGRDIPNVNKKWWKTCKSCKKQEYTQNSFSYLYEWTKIINVYTLKLQLQRVSPERFTKQHTF